MKVSQIIPHLIELLVNQSTVLWSRDFRSFFAKQVEWCMRVAQIMPHSTELLANQSTVLWSRDFCSFLQNKSSDVQAFSFLTFLVLLCFTAVALR